MPCMWQMGSALQDRDSNRRIGQRPRKRWGCCKSIAGECVWASWGDAFVKYQLLRIGRQRCKTRCGVSPQLQVSTLAPKYSASGFSIHHFLRAITKFTFSGHTYKEGPPVTIETSMTEADFSKKKLGISGAIMLAAFLPKCQ